MGRALRDEQAWRLARYRLNRTLFNGPAAQNSSMSMPADVQNAMGPDDGDMIYNSFRSLVLTAVSTVFAPQKPKPQFMTSGAEWKVRRRAQKADKFCEGILRQQNAQFLDAWALMLERRAESMAQGAGPAYVFADYVNKRIGIEPVSVYQLFVDPAEHTNPRTLFRIYDRSTDELLEEYGGTAERDYAIESARDVRNSTKTVPRQSKRVEVVEWWHLGTEEDEDGLMDGQHTVVVNGVEMLDKTDTDWTAPRFPFVFCQGETRLDDRQFWGMGFIESTMTIGLEGNRALQAIQRQMVVNSSRRIYYWAGSINPEHLEANDAEVHIPVKVGTAGLPNVEQPPPFHPVQLEYVREIFKLQFDQVGISQVSAAARREPGIESAVAQRTLNDTKAGRQLWMAKSFENDFVELGHQFMWRARELKTVAGDFTVQYVGKHEIREFNYEEISLERYKFIVQVAPASALPQDYAGRLALVQEMIQSGMASMETGKQLLSWPDLEHEVSTETAEYDYIDSLCDRYLDAEQDEWDPGDYESPDGFLVNKERAILQMSATYFRAKLDKAPDFNLQLLRNYILELDKKINEAAEAQRALTAPAPMGPGMPPPPGAGLPGAPVM